MRLNTEMRLEIMRFAIAKLDKQRQSFAKVEQQLLVECYNAVVPQATRDKIEELEKFPVVGHKWFEYATALTFNVAGQTVRLGQANIIPPAEKIEFASPYHCWHQTIGTLTLAKHKALVERVRDWQGKTEKEKAAYGTARKTLQQLLKSVSTVEKLKQYWPEGKDFFSSPPCQTRAASEVPAVQIEALNKMLGIETKDLVVD